jgi:histo-blood group ABO system transferase
MGYKMLLTLITSFIIATGDLLAAKVGLLIVATGKYDRFVDPLIESARKHFCTDQEVTFFVFADGKIGEASDVVRVYQEKMGWPYDTMLRNAIYLEHKDLFASQDYLYALDADMLFVDTVGSEVFGERVATLHFGFIGKRGTYETDPKSCAYVRQREGEYYFAGGFFGGSRDEFLNILSETTRQVYDDLIQGIIALWHDESHWNRYCIDHPPTVILSPSYCHPESLDFGYQRKLVALDKNHKEVRN